MDASKNPERRSTHNSTSRLVDDLKRAAKAAARSGTESHTQALERLARESGFNSWHALSSAARTAPSAHVNPRTTPGGLPVDPELPPAFDDTPNDERSDGELALWWEKPFVLTREGGLFEVRCLDGGAWDRSTWYATVTSLEAADSAAASKLARWRRFQMTPTTTVNDAGQVQVVRLPRHPRGEAEVLYTATDFIDAARRVRELRGPAEDSPES